MLRRQSTAATHRGSSATVTLGGGLELRQGPLHDLALEEAGWQRAVIRYRFAHLDEDGVAHLLSTVRIHVYRSLQAVRIVHRLAVSSPHLPPAAGGTAAAIPAAAATVRRAIAGTDGEQATLLTVRGAALAIQRDGNHVAQWPSGPPEGTVIPEGGAVRLIHDHDQGHRVETAGAAAEVARRIRGHVTVSSAAEPGRAAAEPPLTVALRRFWQTYPRAVRVTGDEIAVELLPVPSGAARPGDEESWHRIYFWLGDDGYASSCAAATRAGSSSAARRRDT